MEKIRVFRIGGLEEDGSSSWGPWLAEAIDYPICAGDYCSASKVDALLADMRELVEECKLSLNWLASYPGEGSNKAYERLRKAIAAVEEKLK